MMSASANKGYTKKDYKDNDCLEKGFDIRVVYTQKWLNDTYGHDPRFKVIRPRWGRVNQDTIDGLLKAFQIELGIQTVSDVYKPMAGTNNIYAILQGALWCKGYDPGHHLTRWTLNNRFDDSVANAVKRLKADMYGMDENDVDAVVSHNVMKGLFSLDSYICISPSESTVAIREFQQNMNRQFEEYIGIIPCDGLYSWRTNIASVFALQGMEKVPVKNSTGKLDFATKDCCPIIPYNETQKSYNNNPYNVDEIANFIMLLQFLLICNGYNIVISGAYNTQTIDAINAFKASMAMDANRIVDHGTWLALLQNCGDIEGPAYVCSTSWQLNKQQIDFLYASGYRLIGRHLTGNENGHDTSLTKEETRNILGTYGNSDRMLFFLIMKNNGEAVLSDENGYQQAREAFSAARVLKIPPSEFIYFDIGNSLTKDQVDSVAIPYFLGIKRFVDQQCLDKKYRIGVCGSRSLCRKISQLGLAGSSFVDDIPTDSIENIGVQLPDNWAFDQFHKQWLGTENESDFLEINRCRSSNRYKGIGNMEYWEPNPSSDEQLLLSWPFACSYRISSYFGNRKSPDPNGSDEIVFHGGIDIPNEIGTPILAAADGIVTMAHITDNGGLGIHIMLKHNDVYSTQYGHCSSLAVVLGDAVNRGDIIAFCGNTGYSFGPHLHFEVHKVNIRVDPLRFYLSNLEDI